MDKLAIFDVDYTLTSKETLMAFYRYMIKSDFRKIKYLPRALYSGLMFKMNIYDEKKTKETFLKFIEGVEEAKLQEIVKGFFNDVILNILYTDALDMIKKTSNDGYKVILISASPEFYINEFMNIDGVYHTIGTKFLFEDGKFSCKMKGENCKGEEKVKRLMQFLRRSDMDVDLKKSLMFSDSLSDSPLLNLVGNPYLINYKKKTKHTVLKWS